VESPPGQLLPLPVPQVSEEESDPAAVLQTTIDRPIVITPVVSASEAVVELMTPVTDPQPVAPEVRITQPVVSTTELLDPEVLVPAPVTKEIAPPVVKAPERDESSLEPEHPVKHGKTASEARPVRRAGTLVSTPEFSAKVLVSSKEGDKVPVRAQETAPAPVEELTGSEDLRRMMRVLQHVSETTGSSDTDAAAGPVRVVRTAAAPVETTSDGSSNAKGLEQDGTAVKAIPGAAASAQENGVRDGMQRHEPVFTPPATPSMKVDSGHSVEMTARTTETFASLPPETAQSVVDQVVKHLAMQVNGENSEVRIKLQPESLGEVTVHVRMESGKMQAQIDVSQAGVKSALEMQLPQLRQSLSERGIDVQRLDVSFGGDHPTRESGGGQGERKQRQGMKHSYTVDTVEQYDTGRLMGYNTMEMVM
jgi:flagellar hook-length control protein FliK